MTIEEIEKRINRIKEVIVDFEAAHSLEDALYEDFIRSLIGHPELGDKAKLILSTKDLDFDRCCA